MPPNATAAKPSVPVKGKNLSVASLVLGVLSVFPFSFLTGIPAIITGAIALVQRRLGRGMAIAGVVLGVIGSTAVGAGIILALIIPNLVLFQERARCSSVKNAMHVFQTALESYATYNNGQYPTEDESWDVDDESGLARWFPSGDSYGTPDEPVPGRFPINPYTGEQYEYGEDLFYFPTRLDGSGVNTVTRKDAEGCPFRGLSAPGSNPGTIVILGYSPKDPGHRLDVYTQGVFVGSYDIPTEYAIVGFGRDEAEPLFDRVPNQGTVYFVLHN